MNISTLIRRPLHAAALLLTLAAALPAAAQSTAGEVRRIDAAQHKITLRHEAIVNLGMDAMTMVFGVRDKAMLDGLKVGDKVRFDADEVGGKLVVTKIAPAP